MSEDNQLVCVPFGTASRVVKSAIDSLQEQGISVGLIRPITVWPFPSEAIQKVLHDNVKKVMVFELNLGQMVEDVKIAVNGKLPVEFFGKVGGIVFTPEEVQTKIKENL